MNNTIKVSVIVPVYNVEEYLEQCLDSIINQTLKNIEIICVNDYSTDNSLAILQKYAKKYNNIVLINNQENQGAGEAKNLGLKVANGEYILFVDSDDFISEITLEKTVNIAKQTNADIVQFLARFVNEDGSSTSVVYPKVEQEYYKLTYKKDFYKILKYVNPSVWNKLYKREIFVKYNIKFPKLQRVDDLGVTYKILLTQINSIFLTSEVLYFYRQRNTSVSKGLCVDKLFVFVQNVITQCLEVLDYDLDQPTQQAFIEHVLILQVDYVFTLAQDLVLNQRKQLLEKYQSYIQQLNYQKINIRKILQNNLKKLENNGFLSTNKNFKLLGLTVIKSRYQERLNSLNYNYSFHCIGLPLFKSNHEYQTTSKKKVKIKFLGVPLLVIKVRL